MSAAAAAAGSSDVVLLLHQFTWCSVKNTMDLDTSVMMQTGLELQQ